ncbi:MAG: ferrous iron transporter B [Butyricicoccus sp.]
MGLTHSSTGRHACDEMLLTKCPDDLVIALLGNPNTGKSTVFNALTGMNQHTGNWAGKTVECALGSMIHRGKRLIFVDLPGTYSLMAKSPEEEIARAFLTGGQPDCTVIVADATCLERNLNLVLQAGQLFPRSVLCLNLMDEAHRKGILIDVPELQNMLGLPVVPCAARDGKGLTELLDTVLSTISGAAPCPTAIPYPASAFDQTLSETRRDEIKTASIILRAEEIAGAVVRKHEDVVKNRDRKVDTFLTSRATGIPVMLLLLAGILFLTITGANYPSEFLSNLLFGLTPLWESGLAALRAPLWLHSLLLDGVWTILSSVVSVMLPPMAIFFPLFTLLEDVGYLPRVAFNLDHAFCRAHTCGKQALTMCMGFGCNAAGVIGCRIIDSPRERLVAILTNSLVPCNGRFPAMISLLTIYFIGLGRFRTLYNAALLTCILILGVAATLFLSWLLSVTLLKGTPSSFALELPPYRRPQVGQVIVRSILDRTLFVLGRAVLVAVPAGLLIWCLGNIQISGIPLLHVCSNAVDPIGRFLGLDGVILLAFVLGFPANEIVLPLTLMGYLSVGTLVETESLASLAALLTANGWTSKTALCFILFSLFHWPCSTTCLTIRKETGSLKWTLLAAVLPTLLGVFCCSLVNLIASLLF